MSEAKLLGREHEAKDAMVFTKVVVMLAIAMGGIANDVMRDMFEVLADLLSSPCEWFSFNNRITRSGIAANRYRQLHAF